MNRIGDNLICTGANKKLIEALIVSNAEFIVVGGLAVAWYVPERQADDLDILINPTESNSRKVYSALSKLGLSGFGPSSFATLGLQAPVKADHYADILTPAAAGPTFGAILESSVSAKLFNLPIRIPSISMLIAMKEAAAEAEPSCKSKHLKDIELLKRAAV